MAQIVLGIGSSHTPMLNAPAEDWARFIERDSARSQLDKQGNVVTYEELERLADPLLAEQVTLARFMQRHQAAALEMQRIREAIAQARLDALIVVGDDQKELFHEDNQPAILIYRGETIRNVPLNRAKPGAEWAKNASARYYETQKPRDYPVDAALANHLIMSLMDNEFDISSADFLAEGKGEGHAFGFVHNRLLLDKDLPVVPVFLNTYYPPNQPTPRRCHNLGRQIRSAVEAYGADLRVGIIASGGLSHFTIDEEFDAQVMAALKHKDADRLGALPRNQLNSGNSEIRNWICMAGATEHLTLKSMEYLPAYRTRAGTGTGLCFAIWN